MRSKIINCIGKSYGNKHGRISKKSRNVDAKKGSDILVGKMRWK